jgi:putative transposase
MPVTKNKPTTSSPEGSTLESSSHIAPEQEEFRKSLRRLAVSAVQVLIEHVMREELEQCIGASWGECTRHQPWVPQWVLHPRPGDSHRAH